MRKGKKKKIECECDLNAGAEKILHSEAKDSYERTTITRHYEM